MRPAVNQPENSAAKSLATEEAARLREVLKRCPASVYEAACQFRKTGQARFLPPIIFGIIERFVESGLRLKLKDPHDSLCLVEDLGIDSLTMMEIVILVEDVLQITIHNEELRPLRTLGDVRQFIERKLRAGPELSPSDESANHSVISQPAA